MSYVAGIKPIRTDTDYEQALEQLDAIFDAEEGSQEADLRDVLVVLIEDYENEHYAVDLPDPVEALKFRMEQQGLTQKDLVPLIGSRSKVSEVLSRKRRFSLSMIRALHQELGIPAEVLLQDSRTSEVEARSQRNC
jgi:HTH-type transcriptional regulator/antitoxin HigA